MSIPNPLVPRSFLVLNLLWALSSATAAVTTTSMMMTKTMTHKGLVSSVPSPFRRSVTAWSLSSLHNLRGGSSMAVPAMEDVDYSTTNKYKINKNNTMVDQSEDTAEYQEVDAVPSPEWEALQSYRMQQQILLQLRATYLGEALARRGLPIATVADVSTPEGAAPPQAVDWDCAVSTHDNPMSCLFSFDAEPGTKVVAPLGSTNWIGLATLNRLRREDPTKVEPMWHSKYAILNSWFDPESEYSLLQHVGVQGFLLNALLQGIRLQMTLGLLLVMFTILFMPFLEYLGNRFLVSSFFWSQWPRWYRFAHAALPLKLFIGQFAFGYLSKAWSTLTKRVKDILVELECNILEQSIPLTVGVPDMVPPSRRQPQLLAKEELTEVDVDLDLISLEDDADEDNDEDEDLEDSDDE